MKTKYREYENVNNEQETKVEGLQREKMEVEAKNAELQKMIEAKESSNQALQNEMKTTIDRIELMEQQRIKEMSQVKEENTKLQEQVQTQLQQITENNKIISSTQVSIKPQHRRHWPC